MKENELTTKKRRKYQQKNSQSIPNNKKRKMNSRSYTKKLETNNKQ